MSEYTLKWENEYTKFKKSIKNLLTSLFESTIILD